MSRSSDYRKGACRRQSGAKHTWRRLSLVAPILAVLVSGYSARAEQPLVESSPKYAATTTRLYRDHAYVRRTPAPDFWALAPYYVAQPNEEACSLAAAAMVVNAARASRDLDAATELATPAGLLDRTMDVHWRRHTGPHGSGVTLDEFASMLGKSLTAYDYKSAKVSIHYFPETSDAWRVRLREMLADNERSDGDLLVANFLQSELTGDEAGAVGHFAPIGAYDATRERVLIFDPDRRWYEPYWVPLERLLAGMAAGDPVSKKSRGLIRVVLPGSSMP